MGAGTGGSDASKGFGQQRNLFMLILSTVIIVMLYLALRIYSRAIYGVDTPLPEAAVPFGTCFAGVLLFILSVSRRKRETWDLKKYSGEHLYRVAQAFAYLFIILWAWPNGGSSSQMTVQGLAPVTSQAIQVPPNILGFLVGFFVLRVERAMDSLGEKFEEVLMSILPRSVTYTTIQEKRRQILRDTYKLEDMTAKYEVLRPLIEDAAARRKIDEKLANAVELASAEDPERTSESINDFARSVEYARHALGEGLAETTQAPLDSCR